MSADINDVIAYWDRQPCMSKTSAERPLSYEYSQQIRDRRLFVQPHIASFANASEWKGRRVLDAGCGIGIDSIWFAFAGADVIAVDCSMHSISLANKQAETWNLKIKFVRGNLEELVFPNLQKKFDLIWCFGVLHHTPHPDIALRQFRKFIAPDGKLRIMLYYRWSWKRLIREQYEAQAGCPIVQFYSKWEAEHLLYEAGFKVVSESVAHIFRYKIKQYKTGELVDLWYWRICPDFLFRWMERHFGTHLLIEAIPI